MGDFENITTDTDEMARQLVESLRTGTMMMPYPQSFLDYLDKEGIGYEDRDRTGTFLYVEFNTVAPDMEPVKILLSMVDAMTLASAATQFVQGMIASRKEQE